MVFLGLIVQSQDLRIWLKIWALVKQKDSFKYEFIKIYLKLLAEDN